MSEWRFRRRQGTCTACEATFADGDRHVSALRIRGEELAREDHCVTCFARGDHVDDLFFWYTRHSEKKRALQLDLATLEALFLQLEGRAEPRVRELRYVLSLLLMRKRRLRLDRVTRGPEGEAMIVHRPRRKESLTVFVFDFQPDRLEALKGDLMALLEGAEPTSDSSTDSADACDEGGPDAELAIAGVAEDAENA